MTDRFYQTVGGADDASADDGIDLKRESSIWGYLIFDEERGLYYVSFPNDQ